MAVMPRRGAAGHWVAPARVRVRRAPAPGAALRGRFRLVCGRRAMGVVTGWTGRTACALQAALRMSNVDFARHLDIGVRTVADWHDDPKLRPRPEKQQLLDTALARATADDRERFAVLTGQSVLRPAPGRRERRGNRR